MKREPLSKKLRFEVFKRDKFKCQYCGKEAPNIVLHVDHIEPVKGGGKNDLLNLVTSCADCNLGKKATRLSDDSYITKQKKQLDSMAIRMEQIDFMFKWKKELQKLEDKTVNKLAKKWYELTNEKFILNDDGLETLRKYNKKYNIIEILEAFEISIKSYYKKDTDDIELAWNKIKGILYSKRLEKDNPVLGQIRRLAWLLQKRSPYKEYWQVQQTIQQYYNAGYSLDEIQTAIYGSNSYSQFNNIMERYNG